MCYFVRVGFVWNRPGEITSDDMVLSWAAIYLLPEFGRDCLFVWKDEV
jgi:hypothetical protein